MRPFIVYFPRHSVHAIIHLQAERLIIGDSKRSLVCNTVFVKSVHCSCRSQTCRISLTAAFTNRKASSLLSHSVIIIVPSVTGNAHVVAFLFFVRSLFPELRAQLREAQKQLDERASDFVNETLSRNASTVSLSSHTYELFLSIIVTNYWFTAINELCFALLLKLVMLYFDGWSYSVYRHFRLPFYVSCPNSIVPEEGYAMNEPRRIRVKGDRS